MNPRRPPAQNGELVRLVTGRGAAFIAYDIFFDADSSTSVNSTEKAPVSRRGDTIRRGLVGNFHGHRYPVW